MRTWWQDTRYGWRMLARNPGFSLIIVVILAIGIGATTALLSVVDAVLFRPCPYTEANHLVWVCETDPGHTRKNMVSLPNFCDWRRQSRTFEQLVAANRRGCVVRGADRIEKSNLMSVSPDFFSVLGVEPIVGRTFLPEEERPGGPRVVILSEAQWQHWFAGVALILASLGVYGAVACTVSRRTHEIGVRIALGAKSGDVLKTLLGQSLRLTGIALAIGLLVAGLLTRVISRLLQDVSPTDPLTFACVALFLAGVALVASYLPARRAARIDPMTALRYE